MANKKISYTTRDFQGIRTELINFTKTYYPDLIQNFTVKFYAANLSMLYRYAGRDRGITLLLGFKYSWHRLTLL